MASQLLAACVAATLYCPSTATARVGDGPTDGAAFKAVLSARDAALSAVRLKTACVQQFGDLEAVDWGDGSDPWVMRTGRATLQATVRELFVTPDEVRLKATPLELEAGDGSTNVVPGTRSELIAEDVGVTSVEMSDGELFVERRERPAAKLLLLEKIRDTFLGLGVGLGAHLKSVETFQADAGAYRITGVAEFFPGEEERVEAEFDGDLILRSCRLETNRPTSETVSVYTSVGTVETAAGKAAASGTFVRRGRVRLPSFADPPPPPAERTWGKWETIAAEGYRFRSLEILEAAAGPPPRLR